MENTPLVVDRLKKVESDLTMELPDSERLSMIFMNLKGIRASIDSGLKELSHDAKLQIHQELTTTIAKIKDTFSHIHPDSDSSLLPKEECLIKMIREETTFLDLFSRAALSDLPGICNPLKAICLTPDSDITLKLKDIPNSKDRGIRHGHAHLEYNLYRNIIPYDDNRVLLSSGKYISASDIHLNDKRVLAASAPFHRGDIDTLPDWWRMIIEMNTRLIVMTTNQVEEIFRPSKLTGEMMKISLTKCENYWENPCLINSCLREIKGWTCLSLSKAKRIKSHNGQRILKRSIILKGPKRSKRKITWIQYKNWPDFGIADPELFLKFYQVISNEIKRYPTEDHPPLFHCSAGCGRTGTTLALYFLLQNLAASDNFPEDAIDIDRMIKLLRSERADMVQTAGQYKMIARVLIEYIKCKQNLKS